MDALLDTVLEDLDRKRQQGPLPGCLSETVLEALITERLAAPVIETAHAHLRECLGCMHAYASLRRLLELAVPEGLVDEVAVPAPVRTVQERIVHFWRNTIGRPIPAGWALGAATAAVLLTWMTLTVSQVGVLRPHPSGGTPGPSEMIGLAHRGDARTATVTGTVTAIRDATSHEVEAHVVTLRDPGGATYVLFAWGPPAVRQGQSVGVRATFAQVSESESPLTYKGIAQEFLNPRQGK